MSAVLQSVTQQLQSIHILNANHGGIMKLKSWILTVAIIAAFGCGDDEETRQQAQRNCSTFVDAWCTKIDSCLAEDAFEDCVSLIRQEINCGAAVETGEQFDQCLTDIDQTTCAAIDSLPASCNGAILTE